MLRRTLKKFTVLHALKKFGNHWIRHCKTSLRQDFFWHFYQHYLWWVNFTSVHHKRNQGKYESQKMLIKACVYVLTLENWTYFSLVKQNDSLIINFVARLWNLWYVKVFIHSISVITFFSSCNLNTFAILFLFMGPLIVYFFNLCKMFFVF